MGEAHPHKHPGEASDEAIKEMEENIEIID
jgi:hypothetical protein